MDATQVGDIVLQIGMAQCSFAAFFFLEESHLSSQSFGTIQQSVKACKATFDPCESASQSVID